MPFPDLASLPKVQLNPCTERFDKDLPWLRFHKNPETIQNSAANYLPNYKSSYNTPLLPSLALKTARVICLFRAAEILALQSGNPYFYCSFCGGGFSAQDVLPHIYLIHYLHDGQPECIDCKNQLYRESVASKRFNEILILKVEEDTAEVESNPSAWSGCNDNMYQEYKETIATQELQARVKHWLDGFPQLWP